MKFIYSFREINYGSVVIESDYPPSGAEVISAIMSGNAYYKDTEYEDIKLDNTERTKSKTERPYER